MRDEQIIKDLEYCSEANNCFYYRYEPTNCEKATLVCINEVMENALGLINRQYAEIDKLNCVIVSAEQQIKLASSVVDKQKVEIERLQDMLNATIAGQETLQNYINSARVGAIKEFESKLYDFIISNKKVDEVMFIKKMNSLVKEMVGADNEI